jgi:hypothetical protein
VVGFIFKARIRALSCGKRITLKLAPEKVIDVSNPGKRFPILKTCLFSKIVGISSLFAVRISSRGYPFGDHMDGGGFLHYVVCVMGLLHVGCPIPRGLPASLRVLEALVVIGLGPSSVTHPVIVCDELLDEHPHIFIL